MAQQATSSAKPPRYRFRVRGKDGKEVISDVVDLGQSTGELPTVDSHAGPPPVYRIWVKTPDGQELMADTTKELPKGAALKNPRWDDGKAGPYSHNEHAQMSVDAVKLEGRFVRFDVERLEGQEWVKVGSCTARVKGGTATGKIPVKASDADAPQPMGATRLDPDTNAITVDSKGLKGRQVRFVLEHQLDGGWAPVESHVVTVDGEVTTTKLKRALHLAGTLSSPTWSQQQLEHGGVVEASVLGKAIEGKEVEFTLERLDGGTWTPTDKARGKVIKGVATASFTVSHPAAGKAQPPGSQELDPRKLRFRAAVVGANVVDRVRAELLPDLSADRVRFRVSLA
jgi:hypothetical protein